MLTPVDSNVFSVAKELSGKRCLITGSSGFLGRNMIATLLAVNAEVHIVTNRRKWQDIPLGYLTKAHCCDLGNKGDVEALFSQIRPDFVFHFATARGDSVQMRNKYIRDNIFVADNLIQAASRWMPTRMVVAQSSLEYGRYNKPILESDTLYPDDIHGASKAAASLLFYEAASSLQLPIVMLRIFSVYGYWEPWGRLIPTVMKSLLYQKELPLTENDCSRDFVFVSDVIEAFIKCAIHQGVEGNIFNIGTGKQTTNKEVVSMIQRLTGLALNINKGGFSSRHTDRLVWCANNEKAAEFLDWTPCHSLSEGLEKTWRWFNDVAPKYI